MVSTFAVTASGAVVLAATEELLARRQALREAGLPVTTEARALGIDLGRYGEEASLWDVAKYIFSGSLSVGEESDALGYDVRCGLDGCVIDDVPLPAGVD
mmetsp:Transcript_8807/g.19601  ORF Transcript_8807/g.19601 Transcript_8807/m.19601 type:complete len:100 (+) Transcript_8807:394-693(+)